ncbi:hypothetical protein AOLI_G00060680 [Acnodon oligacanthus]
MKECVRGQSMGSVYRVRKEDSFDTGGDLCVLLAQCSRAGPLLYSGLQNNTLCESQFKGKQVSPKQQLYRIGQKHPLALMSALDASESH